MKKVMMLFSALTLMLSVSFAQTSPAPTKMKEKSHKEGNKMKENGEKKGMNDLGLSPEQDSKYKALNQAHKEAVKKIEKDATLSDAAKTTQIASLKSKYEADVKNVMNADQYTKWMAKREKRQEKKEVHKEKMKENKEKMGKKSDKAPAQGASKAN